MTGTDTKTQAQVTLEAAEFSLIAVIEEVTTASERYGPKFAMGLFNRHVMAWGNAFSNPRLGWVAKTLGWTMNIGAGYTYTISVDNLVIAYNKHYNKGKHAHKIGRTQMKLYLKQLEDLGVTTVEHAWTGMNNLQQPGTQLPNTYHVDFRRVVKVSPQGEAYTELHDFMVASATDVKTTGRDEKRHQRYERDKTDHGTDRRTDRGTDRGTDRYTRATKNTRSPTRATNDVVAPTVAPSSFPPLISGESESLPGAVGPVPRARPRPAPQPADPAPPDAATAWRDLCSRHPHEPVNLTGTSPVNLTGTKETVNLTGTDQERSIDLSKGFAGSGRALPSRLPSPVNQESS